MTDLKPITYELINQWYKDGKWSDDVIVIDIREPYEHKGEHIPGSKNIPASELLPASSELKTKIAIFHCRSGNRTQLAKDKILNCNFKDAYCITKGIEQWKQWNLPVISDIAAPLDIMRQVQITAGAFVLIGVILGYILMPIFLILSAFIGAGLVFSGVTGSCGMAKLLSYMPWNKNCS